MKSVPIRTIVDNVANVALGVAMCIMFYRWGYESAPCEREPSLQEYLEQLSDIRYLCEQKLTDGGECYIEISAEPKESINNNDKDVLYKGVVNYE